MVASGGRCGRCSQNSRERRECSLRKKRNFCSRLRLRVPEWQLAHNAAVLALNTTMRGCELKGLRWEDVNLFARTLTIRRLSTKTDAGARVIPLNRDALATLGILRLRAERLGSAEPRHFLFPACENGKIDPLRPMRGWQTAPRVAKANQSCRIGGAPVTTTCDIRQSRN